MNNKIEEKIIPEKSSSPNTPPPVISTRPRIIDSLRQLSKFSDYDFLSYRTDVTEGNDIIYTIPNNTVFVDCDYLYVIHDHEGSVTVWKLFIYSGDQGIDYFYQNNVPCYFSFYDFDTGDEIIAACGNFQNNTMDINYINSSYFDGDRQQVPENQSKPWLCEMAMGTVTTIWGIAAGTVTLGAGFVVSMGFTALSI